MVDENKIEVIIGAEMGLATVDCCGNAAWRGRYCEYHNGMEAGLERMARVMFDLVQSEV